MSSLPQKDEPFGHPETAQTFDSTVSPIPKTQRAINATHVTCSPPSTSSSQDASSSVIPHSSSSLPTSLQPTLRIRRRRKMRDSLEKQPPRKGDHDYIKRPENAFILFRKQKCEEHHNTQDSIDGAKKLRQADLSKIVSQQWKTLPLKEKQYWTALAQAKKAWHEALYPCYVYRPGPRKKKAKTSNRSEDTSPEDTENKDREPVHADCDAFRPQLSSTTATDDQLSIPILPYQTEQTLIASTESCELEPMVTIQNPSDDLFFGQSLEDPSALDDIHHDALSLEQIQIFEDGDMDELLSNEFTAPDFSIPETNAMLQDSSPSSNIFSTLSSDMFDFPSMYWNHTSTTTAWSSSTSNDRPPEGDLWDIDEPELGATPFEWEIYTNLDWHLGPSPEQSNGSLHRES